MLVRGSFGTRLYYSLNQAHVYKKALIHLKNLLKQAASTGALPPIERVPAPYSNVLFRAPNLAQCIVYGCKLLTRVFMKAMASILRLRERWGISVLSAKWDEAVLWRSTEAPVPRGRFWADPFLCTRDGKTFCFVEDFVYKTGKAHITALEIIGTKVVERGIALSEPFHLSFPYLFEYQGELYMCPEAHESGQIRVYRCNEFPLQWKLEKIIMEGVSAVDTMLFRREGKWWMLTSIDDSGQAGSMPGIRSIRAQPGGARNQGDFRFPICRGAGGEDQPQFPQRAPRNPPPVDGRQDHGHRPRVVLFCALGSPINPAPASWTA